MRGVTPLTLIMTLTLLATTPAGAVVMGSTSSLDRFTVRLAGDGYCSGVVLARRVVATASHCARGMYVIAAAAPTASRVFRTAPCSTTAVA